MADFAAFQVAVAARIQDRAHKLDQPGVDSCIKEALGGRYSAARPLTGIAEFAGDGSVYQWDLDATNFPDWADGFSIIEKVEYPADERDPNFLDAEEWLIHSVLVSNVATKKLRLRVITPVAGKMVRVRYTIPHAADGSDVPDADFEGAANLAAALACNRLAALYTQAGDSAIGADAVDYRSKSDQYRSAAKVYEKEFQAAFGMDQDRPQAAASASTEWREDLEAGGHRMTH